METKFQNESPLIIYLSNVHTSAVWTQQRRNFFQQQQEQDGPITCDQANHDEDFAVHLLDIHARFCFTPSCKSTAYHVNVDIAPASTSTEIPRSEALLKSSKKPSHQTSMATLSSWSMDHSSSRTASSISGHSSRTAAPTEFVVNESQAADDMGLQAPSSKMVLTATTSMNVESSIDEMASPSTSAMRTSSGRHGVDVQMGSSEGGEDDSDGWFSEEQPPDMSPDMSPDHSTDMITLQIKTECDDEAEDTSDSGTAYQPCVKLESPDHFIDEIARQTEREGGTSEGIVPPSVERERKIKTGITCMNKAKIALKERRMLNGCLVCHKVLPVNQVQHSCETCSKDVSSSNTRTGQVTSPNIDIARCHVPKEISDLTPSFCEEPYKGCEFKKSHLKSNASEQMQCLNTEYNDSYHLMDSVMRHYDKKPKDQTGGKKFKCSLCPKLFTKQSNVNRHMRLHTRGRQFKCNSCSEAFTTKQLLTRHMRTHTGERPFKCSLCPQTFSTKPYLQCHVRTHTGERPFQCSICPKAFTERGNLRRHILSHTGERPFKCNLCSKAFSQRGNLKVHMILHTGKRPFKCNLCSEAFTRKELLTGHARVHTGELSSESTSV